MSIKPRASSRAPAEDDAGSRRPTKVLERERIAASIRMGTPVSDRLFDRFMAREARSASVHYWTSLAAAVRAGEWLDEVGAHTVLDIGSGAGKFCVAAALASKVRFVGIEHRARLVTAARELARQFEVEARVAFIHGALEAVARVEADVYYLYNPFGENLFEPSHQLDADVELGDVRYLRDVAFTEQLLQEAAEGTYVITYSGFGGLVPRSYREIRVDWTLSSILRMWKKS